MSQSEASWRAKSGSFFSSSEWKRRFSRSRTSPGLGSIAVYFGADTIGRHLDRPVQELFQADGGGGEAHIGIALALGAIEVRGRG